MLNTWFYKVLSVVSNLSMYFTGVAHFIIQVFMLDPLIVSLLLVGDPLIRCASDVLDLGLAMRLDLPLWEKPIWEQLRYGD